MPSLDARNESRPEASITASAGNVSDPPPARSARTPTARCPSISTSRTAAPWRTSTPLARALSSSIRSKSLRRTCQVVAQGCLMVSKK